MPVLRTPRTGRAAVVWLACLSGIGWAAACDGGRALAGDAAVAGPSLADQMPRLPPRSPAEALRSFVVQKGFALELAAAEPDVLDPIAASFDEDGRMYVIEMSDYPFLPEQRPAKNVAQRAETWGRVRLLVDTDGDGTYDRSTIFADRLRWPQSVACYKGGVFVLAPPALVYLKDADGDGVADLREEWATGFGTANVQGLANGFQWGLDHGLWFPSGRAGGEITFKDGTTLTPGRRDLRLDPLRQRLEPVSGGEQYGHGVDDWGNRFVCNNSNHIEHVVFPARYLDRNPHFVPPPVLRSIAREGSAAEVFRISPPEPWRVVRTARRAADPQFASRAPASELSATGFFTSATGVTIYRGDAYPGEFQGNAFIGDVGGNLIHRKRVEPNGASFIATRSDEDVEFIASPDNWFRPVNFVNAPDGTLYVLDMYRETIEHPFSIPDDIKEHVDLESGHDKGRIYRIVPPNWRRPPPRTFSNASTAELVAALESGTSWERETAHRLLWERQDRSAVPPLKRLVRSGATPQSRLHALWSLQGLAALAAEDCLAGLHDPHPAVREHAVRLSEPFADGSAEIRARWLELIPDDEPRVRWQVAFSLGEVDSAEFVAAGLLACTGHFSEDGDLLAAVMSSLARHGSAVAVRATTDDLGGTPFQLELARLLGTQAWSDGTSRWLTVIMSPEFDGARRRQLLTAFSEGLARRGGSLLQAASAAGVGAALAGVLEQEAATARAVGGSPAARRRALALLAFAPEGLLAPVVRDLLQPQVAPEIQRAAIHAAASQRTSAMASNLLVNWRALGPAARNDVVDGLVQSQEGAAALLASVSAGDIKPGEIDRDKHQILLNHPSPSVREQAHQLFGEFGSVNRRDVLAAYEEALKLAGDASRGVAVYRKICIQCHRSGDHGHPVGPDLQSVQNKSPHDLLVAILDPNREVQPNYASYTALTLQGQVATGMIAAETAASITLRRAEGLETVVLRENLDELVATGQSLMPEGLEKDITPEQMADLIAFIRNPVPVSGE